MTENERKEAIRIIKSECYISDLLDLDRTRMVNTALDTAIKALEQTDVPDMNVGKWIDMSYDDDFVELYCCSLCKRQIIVYPGETIEDYPYCHCGARMEVEG